MDAKFEKAKERKLHALKRALPHLPERNSRKSESSETLPEIRSAKLRRTSSWPGGSICKLSL